MGLTLRTVRGQGEFKWHSRQVYLSETLAGEVIGLDQITERAWNVYWGPMLLAVFDDQTGHLHRPKNKKRWLRRKKKKPQSTKKCYPCARSKVLPMYPVVQAQRKWWAEPTLQTTGSSLGTRCTRTDCRGPARSDRHD